MSAVISECGQYRYVLRRSLGSALRWHKPMLFVMLNPSTATETIDDPTIRRCMSFAKREGATQLTVVNLFALRATNPRELETHDDPIGPENDKHILEQISKHLQMPVVGAWGANRFAEMRAQLVSHYFDEIYCLGKNKDGSPRHPLYVRNDQPLILLENCKESDVKYSPCHWEHEE
jgi:hypothetical protein